MNVTNSIVRAAAIPLAFVLSTTTCKSSVAPAGTERWAADLANQRVLFMTIQVRGADVSGTGTLAALTNPGGEPLTLTGTRRADSLSITYRRQTADPFHLVGRYTGPGIVGVLDGAEFVQASVSFRSR